MGDRLQDSVQSGSLSNFLAVLFAILVFLGPVAKSAQFPCTSGYRMQWKVRHLGPNPCRNDGGSWVFLIARMYPVFEAYRRQ